MGVIELLNWQYQQVLIRKNEAQLASEVIGYLASALEGVRRMELQPEVTLANLAESSFENALFQPTFYILSASSPPKPLYSVHSYNI